jgi:pimeloyl-ACP methyl ester carboxylesterase
MYYEVHGSGPQTLVMIRGLGSNLTAWYEQTPVFAKQFRTVVFDNRGAGRTDKPDAPYSIAQMAADTKGLMDALGIQRAALLGISMGGMIAQEFAINYPERLKCLMLGCTTFGGRESVPAAQEIVAAVTAGASASAEQQKLQLKAVLSDDTIERRPEVVAKHQRIREMYPIPPFAFMRQVQAITQHDTSGRLGTIKTPTLVMTGREDRLVPPANSKMIAARIRGARLFEMAGGHLFFTEHPEQFNSAVIDFVNKHPN